MLALTLLNGFFSATEIAVVSVRRARIQQLVEEKVTNARLVKSFHENIERFLTTIQIAITLAGFLASAIGAVTFSEALGTVLGNRTLAVVLITATVAFFSIVFGEIVPKTLAIVHAEDFALLTAPLVRALEFLFFPAVWLISRTSNVITHAFGQEALTTMPRVTEEEIMMMVDTGEKQGALEEVERDMIQGVFELGDLTASDVMVPRVDIAAVEVSSTLADVVEVSTKFGHSRVPVYEDTIDHIVGIVYVKDLLQPLKEGRLHAPVREVMREPYFVPASKKADDLLREMQQKRLHLAICVDEYGGVAGLVTIEDMVEEIVGEIQDEYDREEPRIEVLSEREAVVDGQVSLHDMCDELGITLNEAEADTVAGLVFDQLGRVPDEGDEVRVDGVTLAVLSVDGTRIRKVLVRKETTEESSADESKKSEQESA